MEKYKYLLKNVGIMTLASFGTKILSFLMVPLYTNILSTEAYGTYDIYQTTLFLIVPVLSLNIADGIMRFSLDEPMISVKSLWLVSDGTLSHVFCASCWWVLISVFL